MSVKRIPLATGEFYHVYNKSIADENIFDNLNYLNKILDNTEYYRFNQRIKLSRFNSLPRSLQEDYLKQIKKFQPLIEIYAFSFMPNHFHFLLKQLQEGGILRFISNIQNSYAKYFDLKNDRKGSLFLSSFKYRRIISEELFIHVCRYVHLNHVTSHLIEFGQLATYPFSSYSWYLNKDLNRFVNGDLITNHFKTKTNFIKFHLNQVDYQRKFKEIKDLLLE
jgi:putative transposase